MYLMKITNHFKKKKEKIKIEENKHIEKTGIVINGNPILNDNGKKKMILTNALFNFMVSLGTLGCFVSAFNIKANMLIVLIVAFLIAVIFAFLYYNRWIKTIGYLVIFSGFVFSALKLRYLLKGGFGYVCNIIMEFLERNFALPIERGYDVYGYNEKISVTIVFIFILFAEMLLFNIIISESKGFMAIFLFTFPIVQIGMYFDKRINLFYFSMYIIAMIGLLFLRTSTHYKMETKKKFGYLKKKKKNKIEYDYISDGNYTFFYIVTLIMVILIFVFVVNIIYPQNKFKMTTKFDEWKEGTRDFTEKLALVGFYGMLNQDGAAGGVARSRLGQSKYVKMDYETDLIVQLIYRSTEESIYFKSFNGTFYRNEFWETIDENNENKVRLSDYGITEEDIKNLTTRICKVYDFGFMNTPKYMKISNVAANSAFHYYPFCSMISDNVNLKKDTDDKIEGGLKRNYSEYIEYVPITYKSNSYKMIESEVQSKKESVYQKLEAKGTQTAKETLEEINELEEIENKYSEYVRAVYLDVPQENKEAIKEFLESYNIEKDEFYLIYDVKEVFEAYYEYTLMPGKTPKNKEFINYFLTESKKGYCTYFASAAVLIYRYLGIPARYCGGYVLSSDEMKNSGTKVEVTNDLDLKFFDSSNSWYRDVYEYEIDDSMAHAWVEIYIDGFGWYPIEVTPPDYNEDYNFDDEENINILNFLSENIINTKNIKTIKKASLSLFNIICLIAIIVIIVFFITGVLVRCIRRKNIDVEKKYIYLCKCAVYLGINKSDRRSYLEFSNLLINKEIAEENITMEIVKIVEKQKFSKNNVSKEESKYVSNEINKISDNIYSKIKWYKKIVYRFINWL